MGAIGGDSPPDPSEVLLIMEASERPLDMLRGVLS